MTSMTPQLTPAARPRTTPRTGVGRVSLVEGAHAYVFSGSPFTVAAILPSIVGVMAALAIATYTLPFTEQYMLAVTGGALLLTLGLLAIPALAIRGTVTVDEGGLAVSWKNQALIGNGSAVLPAKGAHVVSAAWQDCRLETRALVGAVLVMRNHGHEGTIRVPGGFAVNETEAVIPLRFLGDRRCAVIDAIRDHCDVHAYAAAIEKTGTNPWVARGVYAAVVLASVIALVIVGLTTSR